MAIGFSLKQIYCFTYTSARVFLGVGIYFLWIVGQVDTVGLYGSYAIVKSCHPLIDSSVSIRLSLQSIEVCRVMAGISLISVNSIYANPVRCTKGRSCI